MCVCVFDMASSDRIEHFVRGIFPEIIKDFIKIVQFGNVLDKLNGERLVVIRMFQIHWKHNCYGSDYCHLFNVDFLYLIINIYY